jgi:signal peptidase I
LTDHPKKTDHAKKDGTDSATRERLQRIWRDWRGFVLFIAVMVVFRSAVADWNQVPSGSMKPSILIGDRIVVDKLAYDLRIPFTMTRIAHWAEPHRGDVVTFPSPRDETLYVKRVIGEPGDVVELRRNRLFINGVEALYTPLTAEEVNALEVENKPQYEFYREQIGTMDHIIMLRRDRDESTYQSFPPTQVPAGSYLMLGDNRDDSGDFRVIGLVERYRILGRAHAIAFSWDYEHFQAPRFDRFFGGLS